MITFSYVAIDSHGRTQKGVIQAESARKAREELRLRELIVEHLEAITNDNSKKRLFGIGVNRNVGRSLSSLELSLITRQLAILLNSSLSVEQALNALIDQIENQGQKTTIMEVRKSVIAGNSLANSLKIFPKVFPSIYCSLVHAGEQSGSLAKVMARLADYSDRTRELANKIIMALLYPLVVTVVAIVMIIALLTYVVPQVVKVFQSSKQALPLLTKILIATSDGLRNYGVFVLLGIALLVFFTYRALKNPQFKLRFHQRLLNLPVAGRLLLNIDVARFSHTLALLLSSGVPMLAALKAGQATVNNYMLKNAIGNALKRVEEGSTLERAMASQNVFPPVMIHLIASGEKSGNLDVLLEQVGNHQELELSHRSQLLTGILEPVLILFMGGIVLLIVIAILLPILDMNKMVL